MTPNEIAYIIRTCRKQSGLSQKDLAKLAGVGKTAVFDIEKAKTTVQLNTLVKVCNILNIRLILIPPFELPTENNL